MFGNVIYYDKKKIDEYRSVIKGQKNPRLLTKALICQSFG